MTAPVSPLWVRPRWTHRLAVAFRFVDAFSGARVGVPFDVWTPLPNGVFAPLRAEPLDEPPPPPVPWRAIRDPRDDSYRFLLTNAALPAGNYVVTVTAPDGSWVSHEAVQFALPLVPPPPPLTRASFVLTRPLWPTRRAPIPPGETTIVGRVVRAGNVPVANARVTLFAGAGPPPPNAPYARTDAEGGFVFRLPQLTLGTGQPTTVQRTIEVRDAPPGNAVLATVNPPGPLVVRIGAIAQEIITVA